jgi:hypothetical protein
MPCPRSQQMAENLRRWRQSGQPRRWVEAHAGRWDHADWLSLLTALWGSEFWPMAPDAVGLTLEEFGRRWWNLRRWRESGQPREWVEAHQGRWGHQDWLDLLAALQESEFWPLNPDEVGRLLEELKQKRANLCRWQQSGLPRAWVEECGGQWDHDDWLELLADLERSGYGPVVPDEVGGVLEGLKPERENLHRWVESGAPRRWVQAHGGGWRHDDWLALVEALRGSAFWPLGLDAVGAVLEDHKPERENLRRWVESGRPRRWVEARGAHWTHADWLALLESLKGSEFWPLDVGAVGRTLKAFKREWWNLRRFHASGLARRWVQARRGRWTHQEWLSLVDGLRQSEFWPLDLGALRQVLEGLLPSAPARAA